MDKHARTGRHWTRHLLILAVVTAVFAPAAAIAVGGAFTDDDTSIFEENIEWLAAAEVTLGCNPPVNDNFCPDDNVTRGQMAAFMQRFAQYLGAEDGTPAEADNADTLDGMDSTDFATSASSQAFDWFYPSLLGSNIVLSSTPEAVLETTVAAPADGVILVQAAGSYGNSSTADAWFFQWIELDDGSCAYAGEAVPANGVPGTFMWVTTEGGGEEHAATSIGLVEVSAGNHTVSLCATHTEDDGQLIHGNVIGTYLPSGSAEQYVPELPLVDGSAGGGS